MSNWSNPTNTTNYANVLAELKDRDSDLARGMDPKAGNYINPGATANATPTNPILYSIRWNSELKRDEIYNGTSWVAKTDTYAINISGNASTATSATSATTASNISGGSAYGIPYQSATSTTAILATGTAGQLLQTNGNSAPTWVNPSALTVSSASSSTTAGSLAGGGLGYIPYQSSANSTAMLAPGVSGQVLRSNGVAAPSWVDLIPTGLVIYYPVSTIPAGFLKCNGAAISRTTYSALFSILGTTYGAGNGSTTFNIPDLRGEFIRGWDDARGVDANRTIGTFQGSSLARHDHGLGYNTNDNSGWDLRQRNPTRTFDVSNSNEYVNWNGSGGWAGGGGQSWGSQSMDIISSLDRYHSGDTYPRNIAMLACIKY